MHPQASPKGPKASTAELVTKAFSRYDEEKTGLISQEDLKYVLRYCGIDAADCGVLLLKYQASRKDEKFLQGKVDYSRFVEFIWSTKDKQDFVLRSESPIQDEQPALGKWQTAPPKLGDTPKAVVRHSSGDIQFTPHVAHAQHFGPLKITCWNIKSPELSGNLFEMYPGWSMLPDPEQVQLLSDFFEGAGRTMVTPEVSPLLGDLLGNDPVQELHRLRALNINAPELLPLSMDHLRNLKKFFAVRVRDEIKNDENAFDQYVTKWLRDPLARWDQWKKQPLCDFIAEDGSGGKALLNKGIPAAARPLLDEVAWDLGLGTADREYRYCSERFERVKWFLLDTHTGNDGSPPKAQENGTTKYDFFKLLVWDLALSKLRDQARAKWAGHYGKSPDDWDSLFKTIKEELGRTQSAEESLNATVELVAASRSDIIILTEMSKAMIGSPEHPETEFVSRVKQAGGFWYRLYKAKATDNVSNTVVLARQERFVGGKVESFHSATQHDKEECKKVGVKLRSTAGEEFQVIGVHLSGSKFDVPEFSDELEYRLNKHSTKTIVAGDFNFDFREPKLLQKMDENRPLIEHLLASSKMLWNQQADLGTVSKKRTPFQCQVSKIDLNDFSMKDFILLSDDLVPGSGTLSGLIARAQLLPDASCPSDHAPLTWEAPKQETEPPSYDHNIPPQDPKKVHQPFLNIMSSLTEMTPAAMALINSHITAIKKFQICHKEFEMVKEVDQDKVRDIVKKLCTRCPAESICPHVCCKERLNASEFKKLHEAVTSVLGPHGQASWERAGCQISWKAEEEFAKVDFDNTGDVCMASLYQWFKTLAKVRFEDDVSKCLDDVGRRLVALLEVRKYEMAREFHRTMDQYGAAFQEMKRNAEVGKEKIELQSEDIASCLQPDGVASLDELHKLCESIFDTVEDFAEELKNSIQAPYWSMGPMKTMQRAREKVQRDYRGEFRKLCDMVRCSVLCKDLSMAQNAVQYVKNDPRWEVLRVKSGFDPGKGVATTGGYRDVKLFARHNDSKVVVEFQLHILMFYVIKHDKGHVLYEWAREFTIQGITTTEDILSELSPVLLKEMATMAKIDVEKSVRQSGAYSRKTLCKRMTLFECLKLSRSKEELKEQGLLLLQAIGEDDTDTQGLSKAIDNLLKREVLLMLGSAHFSQYLPSFSHKDLVKKAAKYVETIPVYMHSTSDKLFLARCKNVLGNLTWGKDHDNKECIQHFSDAVSLFVDCGLPDKHPVVSKALKNLGSALVRCKKVDEGLLHLQKAEASYTELYGPRDHRTSAALLELGIAHTEKSLVRAAWYLHRCLTARRLCFGERDERVGNVYFEMALAKLHHKDIGGALEDFESCEQIWHHAGVWQKKKEQEEARYQLLSKAKADKK